MVYSVSPPRHQNTTCVYGTQNMLQSVRINKRSTLVVVVIVVAVVVGRFDNTIEVLPFYPNLQHSIPLHTKVSLKVLGEQPISGCPMSINNGPNLKPYENWNGQIMIS